ncbi:hypothetical protein M0Q97_09645 [Candidatus Dojkabacteria bacterium]|jgi:hypothetical protein|nr:hypothetical protein [Candidatus Dojkabacteria bacterium]
MTNNEYWTPEVEEALAKYVSCTGITERHDIFDNHLYEPFKQLILETVKRYRPDVGDKLTNEMSSDLLYHLIIHVQKFNPDVVLSSGRKPSGHSYCSVIIRSAIADDRVRTAREKMNRISFDDWFKDHQEI